MIVFLSRHLAFRTMGLGLGSALALVCLTADLRADEPVSLANRPAKTETESTVPNYAVRQFRDLRYSDAVGNAGLFDLHVPVLEGDVVTRVGDDQSVRIVGPRRPAVLVVHGGGWALGDKWTLRTYSDRLAKLGILVINVNYRLAPQHQFPCQVDDVRSALLHLVDHAEDWQVDLGRVGMFGYSAGGHLSALVSVLADEPRTTQMLASEWTADDPRWDRLPAIAAVCAGGPPCDFRVVPEDNAAMAYFLGGSPRDVPDNYLGASPTAHVSAGDPPTQLIHGEKDLLVPIENSEKFAAALMQAGVATTLTVIKNQGHMLTLMDPQTQATVKKFFQERLLSK